MELVPAFHRSLFLASVSSWSAEGGEVLRGSTALALPLGQPTLGSFKSHSHIIQIFQETLKRSWKHYGRALANVLSVKTSLTFRLLRRFATCDFRLRDLITDQSGTMTTFHVESNRRKAVINAKSPHIIDRIIIAATLSYLLMLGSRSAR